MTFEVLIFRNVEKKTNNMTYLALKIFSFRDSITEDVRRLGNAESDGQNEIFVEKNWKSRRGTGYHLAVFLRFSGYPVYACRCARVKVCGRNRE